MASRHVDHTPEIQRALVIHPDGRGDGARLAEERLREAVGLAGALDLDVRGEEVVPLRRDGQSQLVYKHAISTIMPSGPVQLYEPGEDED